MNPWLGILLSIGFVLIVITISEIATRKQWLSNEGSRKLIHVLVSNWWLLAMMFFDSPMYAMVVPIIFVIVNYISYRKQIFTSMERKGGLEDLGTVYYAISLVILSVWTFAIKQPWIGGVGILTMGYGDGFAAIIGTTYGKTKLPGIKRKSFEGSSTMFFFSLVVALAFLFGFTDLAIWTILSVSLMSAMLATILEAITPLGFDNLTIPLGVSLFIFAVLQWGLY